MFSMEILIGVTAIVINAVDGRGLYNDNVFCEDFPDAANMSISEIEMEVER